MCIQSIQKKKTLCKLISATFLMNSVGIPAASAASLVVETPASTGTDASSGTSTNAGTSTAGTNTTTASTTTATASTTKDPKTASAHTDPAWAFHADGTPLTTEELKALNYKAYYTDDEVSQIRTYLDWFGYDWLLSHGFNVSLTKRNSTDATYVTIPHNPAQANSTTDNSSTENANSQTATKCNDGYELVNGQCIIKCESYEERDTKTGKCEVKSCATDETLGSDGKCATTVCPSNYTLDKSSGKCVADSVSDKSAACASGLELVNGKCYTPCADGTTRDTDGVCKTKKKDTSSVCQLNYQEWNADDKKCEDKVCKSTQTLDKSTGECKDNTTCPVGQFMSSSNVCTADACTQQGKETWKKADGTIECVDKCATGTRLNYTTGKCDALTATSCPASSIKKDGKCETCPTGQSPNSDQTACVAPSSGSSSKSKTKDTLGTLAGLAGLFMMNKGGNTDSDCPEGTICEFPPGSTPSNPIKKGNDGSGKSATKSSVKDVSQLAFHPVTPAPDSSYAKFVTVSDSNAYTGEIRLADVTLDYNHYRGSEAKFISGYAFITPYKENFQYYSGKLPIHIGPNNVPMFNFPQNGLKAGHYLVTVVLDYSAVKENSETGTPENIRLAKSFPLLVMDQASTLSEEQEKFVNSSVELADKSKYSYLLNAKVASAVWADGVCSITLESGTIATKDSNESYQIGDNTLDSKMDEDSCNNVKENSTISIDGADIDGSTGHLVTTDDSMMSVEGEDGQQTYANVEGWQDNKDYAETLHDYVAENGDITFTQNAPIGQKTVDGKTTWYGYDGTELSDDDMKNLGLEGATVNDKGVLLDKDGKEITLSQDKHNELLTASIKGNTDMKTSTGGSGLLQSLAKKASKAKAKWSNNIKDLFTSGLENGDDGDGKSDGNDQTTDGKKPEVKVKDHPTPGTNTAGEMATALSTNTLPATGTAPNE